MTERRERFGDGAGWSLHELKEAREGLHLHFVARRAIRDLVSELLAERRAHDETRDKYRAALDEYDRARIAKADR